MAMQIDLTDDGDPVCTGSLSFSGDAGREGITLAPHEAQHDRLCLFHTAHGFGLRVFGGGQRQPGGFYPGDTAPGSVYIHLPTALSVFLESRLRGPIASGPQTLTLSGNDQLTPDSPAAGGLGNLSPHGSMGHTDQKTLTHTITQAEIALQPVDEGLGVRLTTTLVPRASGKGKKQKMPITGTALFLINHATRRLRYRHRMDKQIRQPGLRRAYAGDEVQTDRRTMNLTHPLVYNLGGIFALSPKGTHQLDFSPDGLRINPVSLSGWGWGSVYAVEENASADTLHLPWLSRAFICEALTMLGQYDGGKSGHGRRLTATIDRQEKNLGTLTPTGESVGSPGAPQTLTRVNIQLALDNLGLTIALQATTAHSAQPPYKRTLLLPWEVLILRDFDIDPTLIE
ncbi:MAG: hypothetical protein AAFR69_08090 [Pseudomonadota bacterium]